MSEGLTILSTNPHEYPDFYEGQPLWITHEQELHQAYEQGKLAQLNKDQTECEERVKAARNSAFYEIHTDLMSITCKDSYESMSRRVQQLLDKVHNEMGLSQGGKE